VCDVTAAASTTLPSDASAPRRARLFLRAARCPQHHATVLDDAELLTSELVTNAVVHGAPPVTLAVECDTSSGMRVRVTDGSPRAPLPRAARPADVDGRGMALVDLLSAAWGAEPTEHGKEVWFLLRRSPGSGPRNDSPGGARGAGRPEGRSARDEATQRWSP
jgi:anti-sigma regulatory factor (Ser/Thr protein kinase)